MRPRIAGSSGVRTRDELARLLASIRRGRLATHGQLAGRLRIARAELGRLLQGLSPEERARLPWHRVVADGGAIGRHPHRELQITLLRAEGVAVAPAGIVDGLVSRLVGDLDAPAAAIEPAPPATPGGRSRGLKERP